MAWLDVQKAPLTKNQKCETPDGLWHRCDKCQEIIFTRDFVANQFVCVQCKHHYPVSAQSRIDHFVDSGSFTPLDSNLKSSDPLDFVDRKSYRSRLKEAREKTGLPDAVITGEARLSGQPVHIAVMEFRFMAGSMGTVVGEKISRLFLKAVEKKTPAIVFSSSGGARMQEGLLSLMQMAKTCAALSLLKDAGLPMISVMTNPTTGGVAASYAMLGDINIAEPGALIGFAGPRVIRQTIGTTLPEGFQTAEYLLEHGMLDLICHRNALRPKISEILSLITKRS